MFLTFAFGLNIVSLALDKKKGGDSHEDIDQILSTMKLSSQGFQFGRRIEEKSRG
jgi:hypothetical protein